MSAPTDASPPPAGGLRTRGAETAALAITLAWGLSFVVIPRALSDCGPVTLTFLRMAVGTVAALALLRPQLRRSRARTWRYGLLGGVLLAGGYLLQTFGMQTAGSGVGGFITAFYVTLVPVIDAAVHRRAPGRRDIVLLAVATAGIALIAVDPRHDRIAFGLGPALIALSAVFWAAQIVAVGRIASDEGAGADPAALATIQIAVIAVLTAAALPFAHERPVAWSWDLGASIFFLGYVTCALGFAIQAWAQRKLPPTRTAVLFSPEPVFAALCGWWFRDEEFGPRKLVGAALVLVAVVLVLRGEARRGDARPAVG